MSEIVLFGFAVCLLMIVANHIKVNRRWHKCAYCGVFFSDCGDISKERPQEVSDPLSHGCCEECGEKLLRDAQNEFGTGQQESEVNEFNVHSLTGPQIKKPLTAISGRNKNPKPKRKLNGSYSNWQAPNYESGS